MKTSDVTVGKRDMKEFPILKYVFEVKSILKGQSWVDLFYIFCLLIIAG